MGRQKNDEVVREIARYTYDWINSYVPNLRSNSAHMKDVIINAGKALRERDPFQLVTKSERLHADGGYAFLDDQGLQIERTQKTGTWNDEGSCQGAACHS